MSCPALLMGDPGEVPFVGHLRVALSEPAGGFAAAGRLAAGASPVDAFVPARRMEASLRALIAPLLPRGDRNRALHQAWATVADMEAVSLGPDGGASLSLLMVATDGAGIGVSGVGLSMVWGRFDGRWRPLVRPDHPLLGAAGRPARTPGVLGLARAPDILLAAPAHLPPELPAEGVLRRAGVYR